MIPSNTSDFYSAPAHADLFQGDIFPATAAGLKKEGAPRSPDYWIIITKTCDLQSETDGTLRKQNMAVLPMLNLKSMSNRNGSWFMAVRNLPKFVVLGILNLVASRNLKVNQLDMLLENKMTRYQFLPPDGTVLQEPMIIDFNIIHVLDGSDAELIQNIRTGKILQLSSPFRERVAQRFAAHYADIGVNDDELKTKEYKKTIKDFLEKHPNLDANTP